MRNLDLKDGTTWNIKDTKTARDLKIYNNTPNNFDNTVGIITADGTSMILSYNKNCEIDVDRDGISSSNSISSTLGCISGVFDWNGGRNPNKLGDDVIILGVALGLGNSCAIELDGTCFSAFFKSTPIKYAEAQTMYKDGTYKNLGINRLCSHPSCTSNGDTWAGAVRACGGVDYLPNKSELQKIVDYLYTESYRKSNNSKKEQALMSERLASINLPPLEFGIWTNLEQESQSHLSYMMKFRNNGPLYDSSYKGINYYTICIDNR